MTLYRKEIIERCRFPRHRGEIKNPDLQGEVMNDLCGDEITLFLKFDTDRKKVEPREQARDTSLDNAGFAGRNPAPRAATDTIHQRLKPWPSGAWVAEAKFSGEGCALMTASADMVCSAFLGKSRKELEKFSEEDLLSLYGEKPTSARTRCVMLPLEALRSGLKMFF